MLATQASPFPDLLNADDGTKTESVPTDLPMSTQERSLDMCRCCMSPFQLVSPVLTTPTALQLCCSKIQPLSLPSDEVRSNPSGDDTDNIPQVLH
jgi:hypothetical protein